MSPATAMGGGAPGFLAAPPPPRRALAGLVVSLAAAAAAAATGAGTTYPAVGPGGWYDRLDKPPWTPPRSAFGPAWTVLYAAQAVAAWLVWRAAPARPGASRSPLADPALRLYGAQLLLNAAWSLVFFGLRRPAWAVVEIAVLWVAIAATIAAFARRHRTAAALLVPYLAWVTFAAALTVSVWRRNRPTLR